MLGGGSESQIQAAGEYAMALGMAFQIRDDMLDEIGSRCQLGKPIGSDIANGKSTFATIHGIKECQRLVEQETGKAISALEQGGFVTTEFLKTLSELLTSRTH